MRRPDFQEIESIRKILQHYSDPSMEGSMPRYAWVGDWRGQYQIDMMHMQLESRTSLLDGEQVPSGNTSVQKAIPQESGKTFNCSLHSCARLLDGQLGVWCYPTLRQGARVAVNRIDQWMHILEREYGIKRVMPDAAYEKRWENGAGLMVLSLDVSAKSGVQGYTIEFGVMDESHEILQVKEVIGGIFSRFSVAQRVQDDGSLPFAWINVIGVGGPKEALINYCRDKMRVDAKYAQWDWQAVLRDYPKAKQSIEWAKRNLPLSSWEQFYELKDVASGTRRVFNGLLYDIPTTGVPRYTIGIDVGKTGDYTIGVRLELRRTTYEEMKTAIRIADIICVPHNLKFAEQAAMLDPWIRKTQKSNLPDGITVETNGPGIGLYEALQDFYPAVGGIHLEDNEKNTGYKSLLIQELQVKTQWGLLCCPANMEVNRDIPDAHDHLEGLTYSVDEMGRITWEHSDLFSALLMAISSADID